MKRIPLILSLALLLLLPAIALYPMLHASAEKDGVDSSTAIQEAAPSEASPSEAAPSEAASSDSAVAAPAAPVAAAPAAPVAVSGSIGTDDFPLTDGQQQALHRYMTAYYTRRRAPTAYSAPTTSPPMSRRLGMILRSLGRG